MQQWRIYIRPGKEKKHTRICYAVVLRYALVALVGSDRRLGPSERPSQSQRALDDLASAQPAKPRQATRSHAPPRLVKTA